MKAILTSVLLLSAFASPAQTLLSSANRQIVFDNVNVVPMDEERVLPNQVLVVENGRIIAVGPRNSVQHDRNALVIDASGKYVLPGLSEMHAHVPPNNDLQQMKDVLTLFAANGITTIRGMLGHPKHLELRDGIRKGEIPGPNFFTTGPSFSGSSVTSPEQGAEMVRRQKKEGYDYLKLHPGLSRPEFDAIAGAAKEVGIPFVGHVSYDVGVWRAIEAGYSSIDHLDGFVEALVPGIDKIPESDAGLFGMFVADKADRSGIPKLMKALSENNIWVVPTQSLAERWFHPGFSAEDFKKEPYMIYMNKQTTEQWLNSKKDLANNARYSEKKMTQLIQLRRDLILQCQKYGVGLLLGCDAPQIFNVPGFSTHQELEYLVGAGLTPYQALRTGTVNVAKYLNKNDAGLVKTGMVSDLILLDANPLTDIKNTQKIEGVMIGDKWMDKPYIDAALKKLEKQ